MANNGQTPLPTDLPDYLCPTLRLFLSVDVVNSTAFKQAVSTTPPPKKDDVAGDDNDDRAEPWFSPIAEFYRGIEGKLATEWEKRKIETEKLGHPLGAPPCLWKASGDEVIYHIKLDNPFRALLTLRTWMSVVEQHRKELRSAYPSLDLKAAAWLAGFPVNNAEVVLSRTAKVDPLETQIQDDTLLINFHRLQKLYQEHVDDNGALFKDFIGPSMDTGFRVSALASPRKLAVTIDLAYMIAHVANSISEHLDLSLLKGPIFQYDGRVHLKGVSGGAPYPFFWVDMKEEDGLLEAEDKLMGRSRLTCAEVLAFCTKFFNERQDRGAFMTPYIHTEAKTSPFSHRPPTHDKRLGALAYWSKSLQARKDEYESQLGTASTITQSNSQSTESVEKLIKSFFELLGPKKPQKH